MAKKYGSVYEKAAKAFEGRVNGWCRDAPEYVIEARCGRDRYLELVEVVCGGVHCAGCCMVGVRKFGEVGSFYADFSPNSSCDMEMFRVTFVADDGAFASFGGRSFDNAFELLTSVSAVCENFCNGRRDKFRRM